MAGLGAGTAPTATDAPGLTDGGSAERTAVAGEMAEQNIDLTVKKK